MNEQKRIILIAGARPNFMKIAPILRAMEHYNRVRAPVFDPFLVCTGQHYDYRMSGIFHDDLGVRPPDLALGVRAESHAQQTGRIMIAVEELLRRRPSDMVLVVGDVNSTVAAALAAAKLRVPVAHVEAGLRSFDRSMPEEINRIVTDTISDLLFTTDEVADRNLAAEGVSPDKVCLVGNVMIDTLYACSDAIAASGALQEHGLEPGGYALLTLHRPSNVDDIRSLEPILGALRHVADGIPVVFPRHPRTGKQMDRFGLSGEGLHILPPVGYVDFMCLLKHCKVMITDSGGIQAESTVLGRPCVTLRSTTEFPITVEKGTNILAGTDPDDIKHTVLGALRDENEAPEAPTLWDGRAAERIVQALAHESSGTIGCGTASTLPEHGGHSA